MDMRDPQQPMRPQQIPPEPPRQPAPERHPRGRHRRRHGLTGTILMVIGLLAVLLVLARFVIIPVLVMLGGAA